MPGRATWRMTAWRHMKSERQQSSQPSPAKKARKTLEELDSSTLANLVEYEAHEFELESAFCSINCHQK